MLLKRQAFRRYFLIFATMVVLISAVPAVATPGVAPDITAINESDQTIDPGEVRYYKVAVTGYDAPGTFTFSGTGVTATVVKVKTGLVRLQVTATTTAEAGLRSITVTNPDGLFDTFANGITVTGTPPPPTGGTVSGTAFQDVNGNGIKDTGENGLAGVAVSVTDSAAVAHPATTGSTGDYSVTGLPAGSATAVFTTPANHTLTTGNASQTVTVVSGSTVTTTAVGYQGPPGVQPTITAISESDKTIDPGEVRYYRITASNVETGATATFSGTGLTATVASISGTKVRLQVTAAADATPGLRSLTITNPGGLFSTFADAITVSDITPPPPPPEDATFLDVAAAAGVSQGHHAYSCGAPIGIGAAWADVDDDGDQDLYTTQQQGPNNMYINGGDTNGDGVADFTNVASSLGLDLAAVASYGTVFVDFDNDGDQDLFVGTDDGNRLFRNERANNGGTLAFTDISSTAGLYDLGKVQTATWGDIDNDGFLDLYIAKHMSCTGDNIDRLFHNNGDGTFSDWTTYLCGGGAVPCAAVEGLGFAAGIFDYDQDGYQDIYLVNDNITNSWQPNKMFKGGGPDGSGGWIFTEVGDASNSDLSINGMGLGIGDYNNDGWLDVAFSDAAPGHLLKGNSNGIFTNVSGTSGVSAQTAGAVGWGTAFLDYDNDGWQDLFFAQGSIGTPADLANAMLHNNTDGTFTNTSVATGMNDLQRGRGIALVDVNGDGWVDVYVTNYDATPLLMLNRSATFGNTNKSLTVTVEGTVSNRDGIGTQLLLTTAAGTQRQVITSGSNHGGGSQKAAFFGLGAGTTGTLTVIWPNGTVQNLGTVNNGTLHVIQPTS